MFAFALECVLIFFQYPLCEVYFIIVGVLLCDFVESRLVIVGVLRDDHQFRARIVVWNVVMDVEVFHMVSSLSERRSRPSSLGLY